jgi:hypothetical protein
MRLRHWSLVTAATALVAVTTASAQDSTKQVETRKARIEVPQTKFDFGYVPQGSTISHVFWLKSVGADTLRITDIRPG